MKKIIEKIKKIIDNEKYFALIIILIASVVMCIPLVNSNIDMTYDDGIQHICRIIGTSQGIQNGNTAVFQNFCNGFGYSWNVFYSPITAFLPLMFRLLGLSFSGCIKMFMYFAVFLSGYFMYLFVKKLTKNNNIAIIASIMYIFAPYRFTDMYIRNALAELTSFTFLPLIFLGLYNLFNNEENKKVFIPLVAGSVGMILTHTVIALYTFIFSIVYICANYKKLKDKVLLKKLGVCAIIILMISAFFWMPLLEFKNSADYEVFRPGRMERTEVLKAYKLDFYQLFFTKSNDYMIYEIGIIALIGLVMTPAVVKKIKGEVYYNFYIFALVAGIISAIMTLKLFPFEHLPRVLKMLQFSFRMLEFSSFFFSIVAATNIGLFSKKFGSKEVLILLIVMSVLITFFNGQVRIDEQYDEQRLIDTVPVTSQTGRVHAGCASFEYLPSNAFENRSYIEKRKQEVVVIDGVIRINDCEKNNSKLSFNVEDVSDNTELELPYIFYPGYQVSLNVEGKKTSIDVFENNNGFVGIRLPEIQFGKVNVEYKGTTIMNLSKFVSLIGMVFFIFYICKKSKEELTR